MPSLRISYSHYLQALILEAPNGEKLHYFSFRNPDPGNFEALKLVVRAWAFTEDRGRDLAQEGKIEPEIVAWLIQQYQEAKPAREAGLRVKLSEIKL